MPTPHCVCTILDHVPGDAPYAERVRGQVREALRSSDVPDDQVRGVIEVVERLALTLTAPAEPLPVIDESDVHLICWLAIIPEVSSVPSPEEAQLDGVMPPHRFG